MCIRQWLVPLLLFGLFCAAPSPAPAQDSLYGATVPVVDTSDAQRDQAFAVALGEVLAKVAGHDLSAQPGYADMLGKAPSYVQQYQYARAPAGSVQPFTLQVKFDASAVRRLAAGMGVASWSGPQVPVLLLVEDATGAALDATALAPLVQAGAARGIDFTYDSAGVVDDTAALAAGDESALAAVGRRYHTGLILIGRLDVDDSDWTLVAAGKADHWQVPAGLEPDSMLADAGTALVEHLTRRFAAAPGGGGDGTLWVSGVGSSTDFAQLLGTLRADAAVREVDVHEAQGDGVLLEVSTRAPLASVVDELGAGGRLLPGGPTPGGVVADASLRWLH